MRLRDFIAMGAMLIAASACAPTNDAVDGSATGQAAPETSLPAGGELPAGAAGKISAGQVGKVSPVPAFHGGGADWSVEIQSLGNMRHSITLTSGDDAQTGTAVYQPTTAPQSRIVLTGTVYATQGDRALRITLARGECRDAAGRTHRHVVSIEIEGEAPLRGCGDLAMY